MKTQEIAETLWKNTPSYGKTHTEEQRNNVREALSGMEQLTRLQKARRRALAFKLPETPAVKLDRRNGIRPYQKEKLEEWGTLLGTLGIIAVVALFAFALFY